ncbi:hypothetical protein ACWC1C_01165 [Streptomyces sp. NPDC001705]
MIDVPQEARGKGHDFEDDPPHGLSRVERWTCTRCGHAVLRNGGVVYGSAVTEECAT